MFAQIESRLKKAETACRRLSYGVEAVTAKEFHDYLTGDTFAKDPTTINEVLGSEYLLIHELVEISELKRMGRKIHKNTIMQSPKKMIYMAHFAALGQELNCALAGKDYSWVRTRLKQHKESVLEADPSLPGNLRLKAKEFVQEFTRRAAESERAT